MIKKLLNQTKDTLIALPAYIWLFLFLFIPFLIVMLISVSKYSNEIPPFELFIHKDIITDLYILSLPTLENFSILLQDPIYITSLISSIKLALIASLVCLLIGYPLSLCIADAKSSTKNLLLILVLIPFWTSLIIRVYAWKTILGDHGVINTLLLDLKFISQPVQFLSSRSAVLLGIVYCYLPFMVFPLFVSIEKIDKALIEASLDLGCTPLTSFIKIIVPLSLPGIVAGSILVFVPAIGEFVIPDLLGNSEVLTVGKVIWNEFFYNRDWPLAAAITVCLTVVFVIPIIALQKIFIKQELDND